MKLNVLQRLLLNGFMNEYAKSGLALSEMNKALKIVDKLAFKEDEQKELNVRLESKDEAGNPLKNGNGENTTVYKWNREDAETKDVVDYPREVDFSKEQSEMLKEVLKKKNDNKEFTLENGPAMFDIAKELGIDVE